MKVIDVYVHVKTYFNLVVDIRGEKAHIGVLEGKMELTAEIVRELLDCDITTGELTWRKRDAKWFANTGHGGAQGNCNRWNGNNAGNKATSLNKATGYYQILILGRKYSAHRMIWLWYYGKWPDHQIDHLDGNPANNCIDNLADKTRSENQRNRKRSSRNTSGYPGVCWHKRDKCWRAQMKIQGMKTHIGSFDSPEEAYEAWKIKARELGFTERHISTDNC